MQRIWLKNYPSGVPADIDPDTYTSVVDVLEKSVERYTNNAAFANMGTTLSYGEVDRLSRDFAAFLIQDRGLRKGERIALMMPNLLQYPIALFGALRAGLVVVNINPLYTARELEYELTDSGAVGIVIVANFAHVLAEVLSKTQLKAVVITGLADLHSFPKSVLVNWVVKHVKGMVPAYHLPNAITFKEALKRGSKKQFKSVDVNHDDLAFLQYTGGTTGIAKGAMLTHRNIVANLLQARAWVASHTREGEEVIITALPLYHIFSLTGNCLLYMSIGGLNHLITNPRDMPGFVKALRKVPFTAITGVNTLFNGLLNTPGFDQLDFSTLKITLGGGMAVHPDVAARWKNTTGCTLIEAYGLTEASPGVCINPLNLNEFNGCIGLPIPSTECSIQDEQGRQLAPGAEGELCVRGPQVMKGYWNRPAESAEVLSPEGWLRTGDIAVMNEQGYVRILDRKKDMIAVSGFKVYPNEVEAVVAEHPGVAEVAAVGVPYGEGNEVVKLFVVRKDPKLGSEELVAHCRKSLTRYKVPKHVEFRQELPKTPVGKILRRALRDEAI